jgi:hypothetical protein
MPAPASGSPRRWAGARVGWSVLTLARGVEVGLRQPCGCLAGSSSTEALKLIFFFTFLSRFATRIPVGVLGLVGGRDLLAVAVVKNVVGCSLR